jgi:hypothetical protein
MKLSNAVFTLISLSSLLGASYGSNSGALRQRVRNDQENAAGDQQLQQGESLDKSVPMEVVDPGQTSSDMPKAGTVIPGSYIVRMGLSADLLGINVHTLAASLGVPDDKVFQRMLVLALIFTL